MSSQTKPQPFEKRWYSVKEAGSYIGLSPVCLYRFIKAGRIRHSRLSRNIIRISIEEIERLMSSSSLKPLKK